MKNRMTKLFSLLLAVVMILGITACGKEKDPASSGVDGEPKHLTVGIQTKPNVTDYDNNALTKYLEEKLNIDIEFVFFSSDTTEAKTQLATMTAGKEKLPDVLFNIALNDEERTTYGTDGYLMDLSSYFDDPNWALAKEYSFHENLKKYAGDITYNRALNESRTASGALYNWPTSCASMTDQPRNMLFINTKWLEKVNKEMPTNLDELFDVLRAFRDTDCNENGKRDEIPMVGAANIARSDIPSWIINNFEYVNDNHFFSVRDDGKLYIPYTTDEYRDGVRAVRDLVKEGLLSTLTWTIKESSELPAIFTPADEVCVTGVVAGHSQLRFTKDNPVLFEYEVLPPFEDAYAAIEPLEVNKGFFITTDCEDFDTAAHFLMEFSTLETARATRYGVEGEDWVEVIDYEYKVPMTKVLNAGAYSDQTNHTWAVTGPFIGYFGAGSPWSGGSDEVPDDEPPTWLEWRSHLTGDQGELTLEVAEKNNPKNLFVSVVYSEEELESVGNARSDILTYVKDARAQFANGTLNIDDDAVWNNYVKTIENMGAANLLAKTQAAYDRQT